MINCNYCKYSDKKSTEEPCQSCQKDKAAWAYFVLKKPEESADAISREEAIEIIAATDITNGEEPVFTGKQVIALLKDLDGVIPSRPTGHWIFEKGDGKTCVDGYVCSACNKSFHTHVPYFAEYKYCPNCGAKMESEGVKKDCTTCILDGTDACISGASDEVCEGYIAESEEQA